MYRKLVSFLTLTCAGALAVLAWAAPAIPPLPRMGLTAIARSDLGMALAVWAQYVLPAAAGVGLARLAVVHPVRKDPRWLCALRLAAGACGLLGALAVLLYTETVHLSSVTVLAGQVGQARLPALLGAALAVSLPQFAGVLLIFAAPVYWLVRGLQVRSVSRATFEAWLEVRRHLPAAAVLTGLSAFLSVYVSPLLLHWLGILGTRN